MTERKSRSRRLVLPLLPLRGIVVYPHMILHFDVSRKASIAALEMAMQNDQDIMLVTQRTGINELPDTDDLYSFGTVSTIKQMLKLPGGAVRVLVEGVCRAKILEIISEEPAFTVSVRLVKDRQAEQDIELEAMIRTAKDLFATLLETINLSHVDSNAALADIDDPGQLADIIIANTAVPIQDKMEVLTQLDPYKRLMMINQLLAKEIDIQRIGQDISARVKEQVDKHQKEFYLREQLKVIREELGDGDSASSEAEKYREKIEAFQLDDEHKEKLMNELRRMEHMPPSSPELAGLTAYFDLVCSLPWNDEGDVKFDINKAEKILNRDHFGLDKVKERILEYLSAQSFTGKLQGSIICLVGPPGVGKTSIARSIAAATGRGYARMSLGGVRDEAEIRGHRRTYIGSMPGRIIKCIQQAKSKNALILLDEIDKMAHDFRGDPASAMLEVLDSEQNISFRDHYLEIPFDLSNVLFVTTANSADKIPAPLYDRMEIIDLSSYTYEEKAAIATQYLLPKQREKHGLKASNLTIDSNCINDIIAYYTREAGVRELERKLGAICRKATREILQNNRKRIVVNSNNLEKYLGVRRYKFGVAKTEDEVGVVTGLAYTSVGGDTLSIEANVVEGTGKVELTGNLGDIMKESAKAAISYIRAKPGYLEINPAFYKNKDIHIHVPEGATPKDGPSAGISIATALVSALSGIPIKSNVAMTGEITLRGRVLPIGGLKEKSFAAYRAGIDTVLIPKDNVKDLTDIPGTVKDKLKFIPVADMDTVLAHALCDKPVNDEPQFAVHENSITAPAIPFADKGDIV